MNRIVIVGPKSILSEVVEKIHSVGTLHIVEVKDSFFEKKERIVNTKEIHSEKEKILEKEQLLQKIEGILSLLPKSDREEGGVDRDIENLSLEEIEEKAKELTKKKLEIEEEFEIVSAYQEAVRILSPLLIPLEGSRNFEAIGFTVEKKKQQVLEVIKTEITKLTEGRIHIFSKEIDEKTIGAVIAFQKKDREKIRSLFLKQGVSEIRLPESMRNMPLSTAIGLLKEKKENLPGEIRSVREEIESFSRKVRNVVEKMKQDCIDEIDRVFVLRNVGETKKTFILSGYNPKNSSKKLKEYLSSEFGEQLVIREEEIRGGHNTTDSPPVLLQNHPLVRPFEYFIKMLQPPVYGSIDPTPYFALFFPIFFGLIMGDIGYGLVLFALGLFLRLKFRKMKIACDLSFVLIVCSIYTIIFGYLFGEFFGDVLERAGILHPITTYIGGKEIEWNRISAASALLALAIGIGVTHVVLGFALNFLNALRNRHLHEIFEVPSIFIALAGLFVLIAINQQKLPSELKTTGFLLLIVSIPVLLFLKGPMILLELLSFVGNMLSYARLMAIGIASVCLALVTNQLAGQMGNLIVGSIIAILGHSLNLALAFSPTIQSGRLHYYEFFTKFYKSGGQVYKPFRQGGE